jgi:hypothetical protein
MLDSRSDASALNGSATAAPINEPTASSQWCDAYEAVIDTSTAINVIVAYWAHHDGKLDDEAAFKAMGL